MVTVYMLINAKHGKTKIVSAGLRKIEEITQIHEVYGRFDLLVKIETESFEKLKEFIQNKMSIMEGIGRTETLVASDSPAAKQDETTETDEEDDDDPEFDT